MSYLKHLFILFFIPAMSFGLSNLTSESENYFAYADTPTLSGSSLYLASNDDYSSSSNVRTISLGHYMGSGIASTILGFGIGHAIQGRWKEGGWVHTALQSGPLAIFGGLVIFMINRDTVDSTGHGPAIDGTVIYFAGVTIGLGLVMSGLKIWEMVDIWILPDSIRVISSSSQNSVFPSLYSYEHKVNAPGVRLQWQF